MTSFVILSTSFGRHPPLVSQSAKTSAPPLIAYSRTFIE